MCSICSCQLNICHVGNCLAPILNCFLILGSDEEACFSRSTDCPGPTLPPGTVHHNYELSMEMFGGCQSCASNSSIRSGKCSGQFIAHESVMFNRLLIFGPSRSEINLLGSTLRYFLLGSTLVLLLRNFFKTR